MMGFRMVAFQPEHVEQIDEQDATSFITDIISPEHWRLVAKGKYAYTMMMDNRVLACTGVVEYWPNRGEVWALIDKHCRREFIHIHKAAVRFFEMCPVRRVEATVRVDFPEGQRWMELLGFTKEARLKCFFPDSSDCFMYSRVRE